jgi:hypothetical protein
MWGKDAPVLSWASACSRQRLGLGKGGGGMRSVKERGEGRGSGGNIFIGRNIAR